MVRFLGRPPRYGIALGLGLGALALGCDNLLAKNNPCGGLYPSDDAAEVRGSVQGEMTTDGTSYPLALDHGVAKESGPQGECWTYVSGTLGDADGGTVGLGLQCNQDGLDITLPDARTLARGAVVQVPVHVGGTTTTCDALATVTVTAATGSKAPAPDFVTSDFVRTLSVDFPTTAAGDGDAGVGTSGAADGGDAGTPCGAGVRAHADVTFDSTDFPRASASNGNSCPPLPSK